MDGRKGVPDSEDGVWKKKKTYDLFWQGWAIKCDGEEEGNGIDYAAGVLGWTRPYGFPVLSCGVWTLFYKLAVHLLPGSFAFSNLKTFRFSNGKDRILTMLTIDLEKNTKCRTPTPNTTVFIFAHYLLVVLKHAYFCTWWQSIHISFSLPNRSKRFSMFLCCPLLIIITSW